MNQTTKEQQLKPTEARLSHWKKPCEAFSRQKSFFLKRVYSVITRWTLPGGESVISTFVTTDTQTSAQVRTEPTPVIRRVEVTLFVSWVPPPRPNITPLTGKTRPATRADTGAAGRMCSRSVKLEREEPLRWTALREREFELFVQIASRKDKHACAAVFLSVFCVFPPRRYWTLPCFTQSSRIICSIWGARAGGQASRQATVRRAASQVGPLLWCEYHMATFLRPV